jgi:hypothetical protein
MPEYRVSFNDIEDNVAQLTLHRNDDIKEFLQYSLDDSPLGLERDDLGNQFRPEFDDDGEIVALHYDEELTERKRQEYTAAAERHEERLDDA